MADFYHDRSRQAIFDECAKYFNPGSGPARCEIELLEWSPGMTDPYEHSVCCPQLS